MTNTLLEIKNIKKSYGVDEILSGIDLKLMSGEAVSLVGSSGSGKSTLLHIAGLLDGYDDGDVVVKGTNVNKLSEAKKTKIRLNDIGFIYQFHNLLPEFNVWENVAYPMWVAGVSRNESKARAIELLKEVGLADKANSSSLKLSGGEAQRVAIARGIANNPNIILADEPTGNLDDENTKKIWDLLIGLVKKKGFSLLCVTHDMDLAKKTDKIYSLKNKKITKIK
ncbi:MAG: ABC transporter ATP-binding protein [Alphaproteobacteria bacterium]